MATKQLTAKGSASATALLATSIDNKRSWRLTATGSATSSGRVVAVDRLLPMGGMTDLGVWAVGQPDTAMSRDLGRSVGTDATASRGWLTASSPTEYRPAGGPALWNAAVYAGVGVRWASMPAAQRHALHQVQFEKTSPTSNRLSWEATSWESRRCYTAQNNAQWCSVSPTSDKAVSGQRSGKIIYAGAPPGEWGYYIIPVTPTGMAPCTPGETMNGSVSISMSRAAWWSAGLHFYDASYNQIGNWSSSQYTQHPGGDVWATSTVSSVVAPANTAWVAVVPHISVNSTPSATDSIAPIGEVVYCDMHRVWPSPYNLKGAPTAYKPPRKLTIDIKANRVNLVHNPGLDTDRKGWGAFGTGSAPFPVSQDPSTGRQKPGSLKFTVAPNIASYSNVSSRIGSGLLFSWSTNNVGGFGLQPNTRYVASAYVRRTLECPPVSLTFGYPAIEGVLNTTDALASHPELIEGDWIRLWGAFRTDTTDGNLSVSLGINTADVTASGMPATFWVDDVLYEQGDQLQPYFDGNSPGSDFLWAGTPGYSSSHYYREFRANAYRLNDIVRSRVPYGTQVEIRYARPPQ